MARLKPVLRYPGSKYVLAPWIIGHFPPHEAYVEPFFGSGAVLLCKARSLAETVNDLDGRVVAFFRVLRERPAELALALALTPYAREELDLAWAPPEPARDDLELEVARRFAVSCWQGRGGPSSRRRPGWRFDLHGAAHAVAGTWAGVPDRVLAAAERLRGVGIEHLDAVEIIDRARGRGRATLIYADPPYLGRARLDGGAKEQRRLYELEMSPDQHAAVLEALLRHPGPVVLSGYASALYRAMLGDWSTVTRRTINNAHGQRAEVLWLNPIAARQAVLFEHQEAHDEPVG